jgi:hypothetical protein
MKRMSCAIAASGVMPCATSCSRSRCTFTASEEMARFSGRTSSSSRSLVSTRLPTMRTAPMEMISSRRRSSPVVSQSSATHSSGGGGSNMKR